MTLKSRLQGSMSNDKAVFERTASSDVFCVKIHGGRLGCMGGLKNPQNSRVIFGGAKLRVLRKETPDPIWTTFCTVIGIPDVITRANFDDDWLSCFGLAGVKFCPSPLTLIVILTTLLHYASMC